MATASGIGLWLWPCEQQNYGRLSSSLQFALGHQKAGGPGFDLEELHAVDLNRVRKRQLLLVICASCR